ncbi:hypothetical protein H310_14880 [Aphanomyces invadans]|uniref:Uncharacterized protein n=1 Tax=Aphanomyces invadans TaxID=157072 RepID=A0A024T9K8_9STRA|nr:hypothetical protein H310_14880 [Aphanomyces invadans]ETV90301.1 hypothetical protein H310_14880 [Aphanomyces invadans]|eukprot:XP_008881065.1 hypothetical protein H310_14880 [Aphanomyces invadans]
MPTCTGHGDDDRIDAIYQHRFESSPNGLLQSMTLIIHTVALTGQKQFSLAPRSIGGVWRQTLMGLNAGHGTREPLDEVCVIENSMAIFGVTFSLFSSLELV